MDLPTICFFTLLLYFSHLQCICNGLTRSMLPEDTFYRYIITYRRYEHLHATNGHHRLGRLLLGTALKRECVLRKRWTQDKSMAKVFEDERPFTFSMHVVLLRAFIDSQAFRQTTWVLSRKCRHSKTLVSRHAIL